MDSEIVHEKVPCDDTNLPENSPIDYDEGEISEGNESKSDDLHFTRDTTEGLEMEGRTEVVDAQNTDKIENSENDACNEDDFASGAAIAMAALAAAASANTSSPSAAAEAARAMAPNLVKAVTSSRNEDVTVVRLSMVRNFLLKRMMSCRKENPEIGDTGNEPQKYLVEERLAQGENDVFLQCLLLFQSFRTDSSGDVMDKGAEIDNLDDLNLENSSFGKNKTLIASEKVRSMLHMAEEAYDAMEALLPPSLPHLEDEASVISPLDSDIYRDERPLFVPDLLPPCTSLQGDATLQFFLACQGGRDVCDKSDSDQLRGEDSVFDSETNDTSEESVDDINNLSSQKSATSIFSSMFSSMTRTSKNTTINQGNISLAGVFRKRTRQDGVAVERTVETNSRIIMDENLNPGEYSVSIDREMLGLTVENVLERTVIRTVLPGGAAKKAGAKVGSLIVRVGNVETKNLTHFETIDELRQSQRPLRLVLRQLAVESLNLAREEMGRLIRGGGFGAFLPQDHVEHNESERILSFKRNQHGKRTKTEAFSQVLHLRWSRDGAAYTSKKEESLVLISEKLVWILSLLVIGLEREASKPPQSTSDSTVDSPSKRSCAHIREDFVEASRSVSKVLWDFASYRLLNDIERAPNDPLITVTGNRQRRVGAPPITAPGRHAGRIRGQDMSKKGKDFHNLLVRVGDVLQRTRTFLADSTSPPAALLRGEVISFLCDVLDIDSDMELSEEQGGSSSTGVNAAPLNDLGSAGSLLKLIILNCSMMRSSECLSLKADAIILDLEEEHRRRFRSIKRPLSAIDIHRFHAGNRFLAVVHRLAASRSVSARVTACSLGPILWGHLDFPHQLQLRGVITRALHDVDVIVRKSTASVLHEIAELVFDPRAVPWLVLMCERAMTDPEPQLRAAAMTLTWHLSEHLPNAFLGHANEGSRSLRRLPSRGEPTFAEVYLLQCKLLPVATRLAEDRAPSVRLAVAAQCDRLCNSLGEHWYSVILDVLQALLGDVDENVRAEAILCVPRLAEIVITTSTSDKAEAGVMETFLPVSVKLLKDPSPNVRVALATAAGDLLALLVGLQSLQEISLSSGHECLSELTEKANKKHVDETLIPLLQKLLNDSEPEVTSAALRAVTNASRGNVREIRTRRNSRAIDDDSMSISSFQSHTSIEIKDPVFIPVLSEVQVMRLLPTLAGLANSRQWRVRQGAVEIVPALLGCTSKLEIRSEVAQLCFRLMLDKVDSVRRTAAECLCLSGGGFGSQGEDSAREWIDGIVLPHVSLCSQSLDFKQRVLTLKMIEVILTSGVCPTKRKHMRMKSAREPQKLPSPRRELIEIALSLSLDSVANVRLNFGRLADTVLSTLEDEELQLMLKALEEQINQEKKRQQGGDRDVIYFAMRAMVRCKEKEDAMNASLVGPD